MVEQLKTAIRASGQSLNQLSKSSGIDSGRLSRFRRGERDITISAVEKICRALGLHLAGSDEPPTEEETKPRRKQ
jgi:transcriptional regulator with XRE-family HTH domain